MRSASALRCAVAGALVAAAVAGCERSRTEALSVVISLPEQSIPNVAKATVLVDYSGTGASIVHEGGSPDCAFILPGVDGDFADDRKGTLTVRTSGPRALRGPADIAACRMKGAEDATAADLREKLGVRVSAAEDAAGKAVDLTVATKPKQAERSEEAIAAAQADAVKTAAAISAAAPPPVATPAPGAVGSAASTTAAGAAGAVTKPGAGAVVPPQGSVPAGVPRPGSESNLGNIGKNTNLPGAAGGVGGVGVPGASSNAPSVQDDSAVDQNPDSDPSYDDRDADDERVPAYSVTFAANGSSAVNFGALQFDVTHLGRSGGFIGRADAITCDALVPGAIAAGNYKGERVARLGLISLGGVRVGTPILTCGFRTREALSPNSFQITVTDASDTDSNALEPQPTVVVTSVMRR